MRTRGTSVGGDTGATSEGASERHEAASLKKRAPHQGPLLFRSSGVSVRTRLLAAAAADSWNARRAKAAILCVCRGRWSALSWGQTETLTSQLSVRWRERRPTAAGAPLLPCVHPYGSQQSVHAP
jgi:hypothetical protein